MADALRQGATHTKARYRIGLLTDSKTKIGPHYKKSLAARTDVHIVCDTHSPLAIQKALRPYQDDILAITCRGEDQIPLFAHIIPHVPYLRTPTTESLLWATDKIWMRRRLTSHNKKITPTYTLVSNTSKTALEKIARKVGFPAIVKPTGLAASRLVSIVYHKEELQSVLAKVFRRIHKVYKETGYHHEPQVLVEQFMEGEMYSIDAYVSTRGRVYFCPMVHIKTGRAIGFDDFFGYSQMTPTLLRPDSIRAAEHTATEAVHALGLRSTTVHVELMKTETGWKIIELGPRVGGFRHILYELSYGINHTLNDVRIRVPEKPLIHKKIKGYSVAMKFFAKKEGRLTKLAGIKKAQELGSFQKIYIHKKLGEPCHFAKNGGSSVFDIILFNKERSKLLADVRRLEQMIKIETSARV